MIENAATLKELWSERQLYYGQLHHQIDTMVRVYEGVLPDEYDDFFHEEMHVHLINMIRLAWDDLATLAGKEFLLYVEPDNETTTAKTRAEKLEKWAYGVNRAGRNAGGITMKSLMKVLMWWLVGTANAVLMVLPDYENKSPFFTFRDPRTHFPPVGWSPWNETRAEDSLFAYQKTIAQLKAEYGDAANMIGQRTGVTYALGAPGGITKSNDDERYLWVGEYYSEDQWMIATLEDQAVELVYSEKGDKGHPGIQPVSAMSLYSGMNTKGRSLFADQVSIQAAMARMFSQKLDFFDRTLYPLIFTTPLAGKNLRVGPYAVNEFDITLGVNPRLDTVAPSQSVDADQMMAFALGMSRMLNRNPEQFQGAGDANSAKAIQSLKEGVTATVRDFIWPNPIEVLPTSYANAAKMDIKLWGRQTKSASGRRRNKNFVQTYRPYELLKGREHTFEVEAGAGLAGYQGMLELLQMLGAETISEDTLLEQSDHVRDAELEKRRIQKMRMEKLLWASMQARAAQQAGTPGALKPGAMGKLRKMTEDGEDLFDAITKLEETKQLYDELPPAPPAGPGLPGAPGPGGIPPEMAGLIPGLGAIQGGIA
jgi:hypothetical protein